MKCNSCGNNLIEGDVFCAYCGEPVQQQTQKTEQFSYCQSCGAKMSYGEAFCNACGTPANGMRAGTRNTKKNDGSSKALIIALITVIVVLVSVILGFVIYNIASGGSAISTTQSTHTENSETTKESKKTRMSTEEPTEEPVKTPYPTQANVVTPAPKNYSQPSSASNRVDLYSPYLTYKRMSGIHNTSLTDDYTYYEIADVINQFNIDCQAYMNEESGVPNELRPGGTAYNQQVNYKAKHPYLDQYCENVNVINSRQGGGYYYAWVEETLRQIENGVTKVTKERWVYKLSRTNGYLYIDDYTRDPSF